MATGNPALRSAAAVTGPTAASAALAARRASTSVAKLHAHILNRGRTEKGNHVHFGLANRAHHFGFDQAHAARMIRHDLRDIRADAFSASGRSRPGAFAARQQDFLSGERRGKFPRQRRAQEIPAPRDRRKILPRPRRSPLPGRLPRRGSFPPGSAPLQACGNGPQKSGPHLRW